MAARTPVKPLTGQLSSRLAHKRYDGIHRLWANASSRLAEDPEGAITLASTLIEDTAKFVLTSVGETFDPRLELMPLVNAALGSLALSPGSVADENIRSIAQSTINIARNVGLLRNKLGDAHGRGHSVPRPTTRHAALALNAAGTLTVFLISTLEATLAARRYVSTDGRVFLEFRAATVLRLMDHCRNAKTWRRSYGERGKPRPQLHLVGDAGIYLMSNGHPRQDSTGKLIVEDAVGNQSLVAYAKGCDPTTDEFDDWWLVHNAIDEGSDFCIPLPLRLFDAAIDDDEVTMVIVVDGDRCMVIPGSEAARLDHISL